MNEKPQLIDPFLHLLLVPCLKEIRAPLFDWSELKDVLAVELADGQGDELEAGEMDGAEGLGGVDVGGVILEVLAGQLKEALLELGVEVAAFVQMAGLLGL